MVFLTKILFIYFNSYFYSLRGTHLYDEDGLDVLIKGRIRLSVSDISSIFRMTMDVVDGDLFKRLFGMDLPQLKHLGGVSKTLNVLQMDAILQIWSRHRPHDPFRFMKAFDPIVWILLFAAITRIVIASTEVYGQRFNATVLDNYYKGYSHLDRDSLRSRSEIHEYVREFQDVRMMHRFLNETYQTKTSDNITLLFWRSFCLFVQNHIKSVDEELGRHLYVSDQGGDTQPLFYIQTFFASEKLRNGMDHVIQQLTESGIFQRWVKWATFGWRDFDLPEPLVTFKVVAKDVFFGSFCFCAVVALLTIPVLLAERAFAIGKEANRYFKRRGGKRRPKGRSTVHVGREFS